MMIQMVSKRRSGKPAKDTYLNEESPLALRLL